MTGFTRHDLPADIAVFAGDFASQPLAFAHLLDAAPGLDLTHVTVIRSGHVARLGAHFDDETALLLMALSADFDTLLLILPAAWEGLDCLVTGDTQLTALGLHRGTVPHMVRR